MFLVVLIIMAGSAARLSAQSATASGTHAGAVLMIPMGLSKDYDMDFGIILITEASGVGTVTMPSILGTRTFTGSAIGNSSSLSDYPNNGVFQLSGLPNRSYTFTISPGWSGNVILTKQNGSATMIVDNFTVINHSGSEDGKGSLDSEGWDFISLGATLHIPATHAPGTYSGSMTVSVDYQ